MSRFLVLGAGKMGVVLAKDLIESDSKNSVTLVDINPEKLRRAKRFIRSKRLVCVRRDIENQRQRKEIFDGQDAAASALLHKHSLLALETAVRKGVHFVDLVGEKPLERFQFDKEAKKKNITVISGQGLSPGLTNICVGRAVHLLDEADRALIYVGGNPVQARPPLKYRLVYAVESVLDFYEREVLVLKKGKIRKVQPLSGIEDIHFPPSFPEMECFYTDGLNSLLYTMKGKVKDELAEKTIRHKGHASEVKTLKDCGFFSRRPYRVNDKEVVPRKFLEAVLDSKLRLGKEKDVTLLRVLVSGRKSGKRKTHVFEMVDYYDSKKGYTSMAKTTSLPASITAQMIASGKITKRGSIFPEEVFHSELFDPFIKELKKRGVVITHKVETD